MHAHTRKFSDGRRAGSLGNWLSHVSAWRRFADARASDYLLLLGANPIESNGSLATAPDWPGRHRVNGRTQKVGQIHVTMCRYYDAMIPFDGDPKQPWN